MEEKKLVKDLRNGNEDAFRFLVEKYKKYIFNIIVSTIQNIEADDLTQEVFIQVFKSIDNFKEKSSLSTWIYRITLSKCYEHIRYKEKKRFSQLVNLFRDDGTSIDIPTFEHPGVILEKKKMQKFYLKQ